MKKKRARINQKRCVACGCCVDICPKKAISIYRGIYAQIDDHKCVGCGRCVKECPGTFISMEVFADEN